MKNHHQYTPSTMRMMKGRTMTHSESTKQQPPASVCSRRQPKGNLQLTWHCFSRHITRQQIGNSEKVPSCHWVRVNLKKIFISETHCCLFVRIHSRRTCPQPPRITGWW